MPAHWTPVFVPPYSHCWKPSHAKVQTKIRFSGVQLVVRLGDQVLGQLRWPARHVLNLYGSRMCRVVVSDRPECASEAAGKHFWSFSLRLRMREIARLPRMNLSACSVPTRERPISPLAEPAPPARNPP